MKHLCNSDSLHRLAWGVAGVLYYLLIEIFARSVPSSEAGVRIAATVLLLAGVYQFSPLKDRCLATCRAPLGFLMTHGGRMARGAIGYIDVGARHGLFCLGCCWMLLVVLLLLGVMNIFWMLLVGHRFRVCRNSPNSPWLDRLGNP
jgi:predicted metal-binding membrane protein